MWYLVELVDVGAHTVDHVYLRNASYDLVKREIDQSRKTLQELFHIPAVSFAYPIWAFDKQAIDLVNQAGFETAVTTIPGDSVSKKNKYFIYRIRPGVRIGEDLVSYLNEGNFKAY